MLTQYMQNLLSTFGLPGQYSIRAEPTTPADKTYLNGDAIRRFTVALDGPSDDDLLDNLIGWLEAQAHRLPPMEEGVRPLALTVLPPKEESASLLRIELQYYSSLKRQ